MTQLTTGEMTHDVTCSDCGTLFACARGHESEIHERRRLSGWHDRCPSCAREAMERFYKGLPPLTGHPVREPMPVDLGPDDEAEFGGGVGGEATFRPR